MSDPDTLVSESDAWYPRVHDGNRTLGTPRKSGRPEGKGGWLGAIRTCKAGSADVLREVRYHLI